ncbi:hypothetical protein JGS39_03465 [Streptomyces sp. P01-B04]|uniref:hypothetical protein n=1 Tax=Streptomyces poriferorum TaxID=2798799 RepID=UPI001C5E855D|nr:hypothetical protein [Streptomyces poriferorum]MBW5248093.1 hypothetical protein [Streptomyces poriferorum]MBW5255149.1 hypothetical protein [Streptomyces poriferorum]
MRAGPQPQGAPRTELLPENLAQDVVDEIDAYLERVPHGTSCLATGSLIEGFGNSNSDIDLYVIQPSGSTATKPIAIGIRDSRYVDVEYLNLAALHKLADAFRDTTPDEAPQALTLRDFDRYYRLSVAARLKVTDEAEAVLDRCSAERSAALFARWSLAQAAAYLARATVAGALREVPRAVILARQAAVWRATSQLADEGEAYPRLKWVTVKAARRFGADTPGYRSCLQGHDLTPADLESGLVALRERISPDMATGGAGDAVSWTLAEDVATVTDGTGLHLIRGSRSITRIEGLARMLIGHLTEGASWPSAVERTARQLAVSPGDVRTTATPLMRELADAGYAVSSVQGVQR